MAAQFTNFETDAPSCLDQGGPALPDTGVLFRLTIGSELEWEGNLVRPAFVPSLDVPPGPGSFVDDCGADRRLFGMFFGPDGQMMTAHALIGREASGSDIAALTSMLASLAPTGHAPVAVPSVETVFASGTDPSLGKWVMTLRPEAVGAVTFTFRTQENAWGIYIDDSSQATESVVGNIGPGRLVVVGIAPAATSSVALEIDGGMTKSGSIRQLPEAGPVDGVAFWTEPFEGELSVEGQQLTPGAVLIARDSEGHELARRRLP